MKEKNRKNQKVKTRKRNRKKKKERKEKEEQEKESKGILPSSFVELNLQELVEEFPKETSSNKFTSLKMKTIHINPSASLNTQPSFGSQTRERNEGQYIISLMHALLNVWLKKQMKISIIMGLDCI